MTQNARIARVLSHIDAHLGDDLSLDALASVAALSRFHFSRVFRAETGEGVAQAVRRARLNRAVLLVTTSDAPLAQIAAQTGFGHVGSFERAFTSAFSITPTQARKQATILPALLAPETGDYTMCPTEIREGEAFAMAALPHSGAYQDIGQTFERLVQTLNEKGLWRGSGPSHAIYYDDPGETPVQDLRAHACQKLAEGAAVPDGLDHIAVDGGKFLVLTCKGPYSKLPEAWGYLYQKALPEAGHEFRDGLPFERYITDAWSTPPEDNVTEIWMPIT